MFVAVAGLVGLLTGGGAAGVLVDRSELDRIGGGCGVLPFDSGDGGVFFSDVGPFEVNDDPGAEFPGVLSAVE